MPTSRVGHDGRLERAVEVHSSWGTFEWLLHDAFELGYRVGVVCHSDDHKGRPGATPAGRLDLRRDRRPDLLPDAASSTRDALFEALRRRRHYGTTGTRLFIDVRGTFAAPVTALLGRSAARRRGRARACSEALMGDIVRPGAMPMRLVAEVIGTAPIERVDVLHGTRVARDGAAVRGRRSRPAHARALGGRRVSRPRPRDAPGTGARARRQCDRPRSADELLVLEIPNGKFARLEGTSLAWSSVTTGNLAGIDLWLEEAAAGNLLVIRT